MLLLILAGIVYAIWFESLETAVITAALIVYRAYRPSPFMGRLREVWYQRQATTIDQDQV